MKRPTFTLSQEELKKYLHYDPDSGVFTRINGKNKQAHSRFSGKIAGTNNGNGYWSVGIVGKHYYAHRLAWLYVYGEWPLFIDHIDGDRMNNRINNLRTCSRSSNAYNMKRPAHNTSGVKGVCFHKGSGKYMPRIVVGRKAVYLGLYLTIQEAAEARNRAALKLHGEFARSA